MHDIHQICKARNIAAATMMPCQHKINTIKIPRSRWVKIVEMWRPFQRTFCTCKIIPFAQFRGGDTHYKFRMLCNNVVFKATDCGCSLRECSSAHLPKRLSTLLVSSLFRMGHFDFNSSDSSDSSDTNHFRLSKGKTGSHSADRSTHKRVIVDKTHLEQASEELEEDGVPDEHCKQVSTGRVQFDLDEDPANCAPKACDDRLKSADLLQSTHNLVSCRHDRTFAPHSILTVHKLISAQELPDSTGYSAIPGGIHSDDARTAGPRADSKLNSKLCSKQVKAFPTDSKERQTAQKRKDKEAGIVREVKKLKKFVEDHNDDCGEDLSSLGNLDALYVEASHSAALDSSEDSDTEEHIFHNLQLDFLWGGEAPVVDFDNLRTVFLTDMCHALDLRNTYVSKTSPTSMDIAEICGGVARTTQVAMRFNLKTGSNFDLITGFDLTIPSQNAACLEYFTNHEVFCAIMAPVCGPYGPMSKLNNHLHPDSMHAKEREVRPLATLCGEVALVQMKKGLYFIQEQPYPSNLYYVDPWPAVFDIRRPGMHAVDHPEYEVLQVAYDRCAVGLKVQTGRFKGMPIKKRSTMTANCTSLLRPFLTKQCKHHPDTHLPGAGHPRELREAQIWTWQEANLIISGVMATRKKHRKDVLINHDFQAFPAITCAEQVATAMPGGERAGPHEAAPANPKDCKCQGCKSRRPTNHWQHNRIFGECRHPYTPAFIPTCQACYDMKPQTLGVDGEFVHTFTKGCWYWGKQPRAYAPRKGQHPRDPAMPATGDANSGQRGDAGIETELAHDAARSARHSAASSSSTEPRPPMTEGSEPLSMSRSKPSKQERRSGASQPKVSEGSPSALGGEGPPDTDDWKQFDIARVLRTLRMAIIPEAKVALRKLHIRWWHASAASMQKLLDRAGVPDEVLKLIPAITQTCSACRNWAKPQPENVTNVDLPDYFNHQVEADLMFVFDRIVFHCVDRSTRWYHSLLITDKKEETLIDALDSWVRLHGPMKELYMDQETAIQASAMTTQYLSRHGIMYHPRAQGQQVAYIDRRGALVRDAMHKIVEQLKIEKIKMDTKFVLSEATFCTNAMLTVNNSTPYNCVYGRVPHILPSIDQSDAINEDSLEPVGSVRYTHRLREISVAAVLAATAKVRAQRATNTRSLPAGQREKYQVGDLVDFYRPLANGSKDASGWIGPAKVIDPTHMDRGCITVKHVHRPVEIRIGDLRRHMPFFVFLASSHSAFHNEVASWTYVRNFISSKVSSGKSFILGATQDSDGKWHFAPQTNKHLDFYNKAIHFVANALRLEHVCALRVGNGCAACPAIPNMVSSQVAYWYTGQSSHHFIQHADSSGPVGAINWRTLDEDSWKSIKFLQVFCSWNDDHTAAVHLPEENTPAAHINSRSHSADTGDTDGISHSAGAVQERDADVLSTIYEEDPTDVLFVGENIDYREEIKQANIYAQSFVYLPEPDRSVPLLPIEKDISNLPTHDHDIFEDVDTAQLAASVTSQLSYNVIAANVRAGLPRDFMLDAEDDFEIYYEGDMYKLLQQDDMPLVIPEQGEYLVEHVYKSSSKHKNKAKKKPVVARADSDLTAADQAAHWPEVAASMKKELKTWLEYECISRKKRSDPTCRNIIDCRWVIKWKHDQAVQDAASTTEAVKRWVIRSRLCLRGFKDVDAQHLDSYAGTATRWTQRVLASESVIRKWDMCTTDISKAFLQGVTYKELAAATGEPLREVNFTLPAYANAFIRELPGWEDFNPATEVIHCDKPGTGCNDAPRCFSMKLAQITQQEIGMKACTVDNELCILHESHSAEAKKSKYGKRLVCIMAKHVDDLKLCGEYDVIVDVLAKIQKVFGELKIEWNNFTNCGVRHKQDTTTKEVTLDQDDYIKGIKLCTHTDLTGKKPEELACTELHQQYWSVTGAIAYAILTRPDIAVFVAALQRVSHAPTVIHCKRLNSVVRWAQRNPKGIHYVQLEHSGRPKGSTVDTHLRMISDAAFKKEEDSGHSMRGACYVRCLGGLTADMIKTVKGHLLDYVARQQRRVTRATFTSELQGGCDTVDKGFLILQVLDELTSGRSTAAEAMQRRETGGFAVPGALYLDALSVYASVTATFVKTPADNGVLIHCLYLRELLDNNVIWALIWQDTRDMLADGLTKGSVDRKAIHDCMDGLIEIKHECKPWRPKHLERSTNKA